MRGQELPKYELMKYSIVYFRLQKKKKRKKIGIGLDWLIWYSIAALPSMGGVVSWYMAHAIAGWRRTLNELLAVATTKGWSRWHTQRLPPCIHTADRYINHWMKVTCIQFVIKNNREEGLKIRLEFKFELTKL